MTARILPFPREVDHRSTHATSGGAPRALGRRPMPALPVEYGSGWYHDAAIKDEARSTPRKG